MDIREVAASTFLAGASALSLAMTGQNSLLSMLLRAKEREKVKKKPTILIVEGDKNVRASWAKALSRIGPIKEASSRREALGEIPNAHILILDLRLDGSNGGDVLYEWQRLKPEAPVCVISEHVDLAKRDELLTQSVYNVIEKPISMGAMIAVVTRYAGDVLQLWKWENATHRITLLERGYILIFMMFLLVIIYTIMGPEGFKWFRDLIF